MPAVTGCPRSELDLSQNTELDLTIPFVSPHSHFNLASGEGYYGKLIIVVYSPLSDPSGSGKVDCTAWINFENIDLAFPTGATLVTSSINPVAQVGTEEVKVESYRSIAQDTGKLSEFLKGLPLIPVLSNIVQPVTWALDGTSAFLKFCGYSKLQSTNVPSFLKQTPTHFMPNYDGVDMSHNLGMASENSIELMPSMVGNDNDEMAIHHIVSTPCYFRHFSWSTTQSAGTVLTTFPVLPLEFVTQGGNSTYCPTHLTYSSAIFQYWRGSIDITFKFVKTKFHSGRVRIIFQPGYNEYNSSKENYNYSMVVDLRSETDIVFRVPYVATHPWLQTCASTSSGMQPFLPDLMCGVITMEILNELVAVSTVSSSIDVLMEVSAGPDYELACPTNSPFVPVLSNQDVPPTTTTSTTSATESLLRRARRAIAQVGEEASPQEQEQDVVAKDQLGSKTERPMWFNQTNLIGEKVISIRQLIKRSFQIASVSGTSATISPFRFVFGPNSVTSPPITPVQMGYLDYFAHIYAFWRGSVNIKVVANPTTLVQVYYRVGDIDGVYQNSLVGPSLTVQQFGAFQPIYTQLEGCADLAVPFYAAYHMCPVTDLPDNVTNSCLGVRPKGLISVSNLDTNGAVVYRHATDSFQFGYLIGPPIVQYVSDVTP